MSMHRLGALALRARLCMTHRAWQNSVATLLCLIGAALWLAALPHSRRQLEREQQQLLRAQQSLASAQQSGATPARPVARIRLEQFHAALGERRFPEQQVKTLFALASKTGLTLNRAEYKYAHDKNAAIDMVRITLPVNGPYLAIRQFCEQTLLAIPFASLDEISFKRTAIGSNRIEASLRFTLYLAAPDLHRSGSGTT